MGILQGALLGHSCGFAAFLLALTGVNAPTKDSSVLGFPSTATHDEIKRRIASARSQFLPTQRDDPKPRTSSEISEANPSSPMRKRNQRRDRRLGRSVFGGVLVVRPAKFRAHASIARPTSSRLDIGGLGVWDLFGSIFGCGARTIAPVGTARVRNGPVWSYRSAPQHALQVPWLSERGMLPAAGRRSAGSFLRSAECSGRGSVSLGKEGSP